MSFLGEKQQTSWDDERMNGRGVVDEKDYKILKILSENARASYTEIARKLGISDVAVLKRIKKLESMGVIRKYTIKIDPKKLGYGVVSFTGIDVEPEHLFNVVDYIRGKEYLKYLAITSGDHSLMTIIWARNSGELAKIHEELSKLPGVKRLCPAIVLDVIKED